MTSAQLSEWEAYDKLDPIGEWREDYRFAYLASLLHNIALSQGGEKDDKKYMTPYKFLENIRVWEEKEEEVKKQSIDEMVQALKGIARVNKSKPKRIKRPPASITKKEKP